MSPCRPTFGGGGPGDAATPRGGGGGTSAAPISLRARAHGSDGRPILPGVEAPLPTEGRFVAVNAKARPHDLVRLHGDRHQYGPTSRLPAAASCHGHKVITEPRVVRVLPAVRPAEQMVRRRTHDSWRRADPISGAQTEQLEQRDAVDQEPNLVAEAAGPHECPQLTPTRHRHQPSVPTDECTNGPILICRWIRLHGSLIHRTPEDVDAEVKAAAARAGGSVSRWITDAVRTRLRGPARRTAVSFTMSRIVRQASTRKTG